MVNLARVLGSNAASLSIRTDWYVSGLSVKLSAIPPGAALNRGAQAMLFTTEYGPLSTKLFISAAVDWPVAVS